MIVRRILIALALALLPPAGAMAAPAMRVLHITDTQVQTVARGTQVEIRLPAMLGAGFTWSLAPHTGRVLKPGEDGAMTRGPNDPTLDGSPDVQFFRFMADRSGSETLVFDYHQPFDHTARPSKTYSVTITVR
jgi:inhibitor of cysteine peptidase